MRLLRHSIRFTTAVVVLGLSAPAMAGTEPEGLVPGSSRQPTSHATQSAAWDMGTLTIPAIGLEETVRLGVDSSVLDQGAGFWAGTSTPGSDGNVVLAGHRTTHSRPFNKLDRLKVGDIVTMTDAAGIDVMYRVSDSFIVEPSDLWITFDYPTPTLTMFACHPKGSDEKRIVVVAELLSTQRML